MTRANIWHEQLSPDLSKMVFVVKSGQTWTKRPTQGRAVPPLCLKMADKYHQHLRGGIVGKLQKFGPFSNNLLWLFENGRKQTINCLVRILLENGRNFCRFLTTTTSCLKTAENKPSTILWGLCWKTAEISAVFQQLVFGRFPTTQNVSAVFQQRGFGRFPTIFFGRFPHPQRWNFKVC